MDQISKHDPHAYEGKMCRYSFSWIMTELQEFIWEISPQNEQEDKEYERLCKVMIREKLDRVIAKITNLHNYYLYEEPREDPENAELKEEEETPEWKKQHCLL